MSLRKPAVDRLDANAVPPDCACTATKADVALADIRAMAIRECGRAGTNRALLDFCLDIINRTRGL